MAGKSSHQLADLLCQCQTGYTLDHFVNQHPTVTAATEAINNAGVPITYHQLNRWRTRTVGTVE